MMLILPCLLLLVAPLQVASQLPAALLELHRHEIVNAKERGAVCNDGSPGTSMHVQTAESRALPLGHSALKSSTLRLLTLHPRRRSTLPLPTSIVLLSRLPPPGRRVCLRWGRWRPMVHHLGGRVDGRHMHR